jgi:hypothetical protein
LLRSLSENLGLTLLTDSFDRSPTLNHDVKK